MIIKLELEDTFGDDIRKAARGIDVRVPQVAAASSVPAERIELFLKDAATPSEEEAQAIGRALKLDPNKLADIALARWRPQEREQPKIIGHQVNAPHPSSGYFIILEDKGVATFVDPGGSPDNIVSTLSRAPVRLEYILITHKHPDHIDALADVRRAFPSAKVAVHRTDAPALGAAGSGAQLVNHGDRLPFGGSDIEVLHTPGHTDGSICFVHQGAIFTGDTLFSGSVGGCFGDRFGYRDLLNNIATKIFTLPDATAMFPGHGPPSTIGEEKAHNPFF